MLKYNFGGRPVKFKKPIEMQVIFDEYINENFKFIKNDDGTITEINLYPISIIGLTNRLGITRETLCKYGNKKEFSDTVSLMKNVIEQYYLDMLITNPRTAGITFILKNCFKENWQDKSIIESTNKNVNSTLDINFIDKTEDIE